MKLSVRFLDSVANVNNFVYLDKVELYEGNVSTVYFQLIDSTKDKSSEGFKPAGRRYMPLNATVSLSVVLDNIDTAKRITKTATQVSAYDGSIWSISLSASDAFKGTVNLSLTLTEGSGQNATTIRGFVPAALLVQSQNKVQ